MQKIVRYNILSHTFLVISLVLIIASFFFRGLNLFQLGIIFICVAIYLGSSILHHFFDKSLTWEVGFEYILIGLLVVVILFNFL